jgi:hypothetical protein
MDVASSARMFYTGGQAGQRGLLDVPGWQTMSIAAAAQAVQVSAFPSAYARWESLARSVVARLGGVAADAADAVDTVECTTLTGTGTVTWPVPGGPAHDSRNWGNGGALWAHGHTGTDFSVPCGTPVFAATGGTIVIERGPSWFGTWLVKVSTGQGRLTTWYAHMQAVTVTDGQSVTAGQKIGEVGSLGNSTGCHLHFEVHPHGGSIYEDGVNPSAWLAANVGRNLGGPDVSPVSAVSCGPGIRVATFNTLGASHTGRGGKAPGMASGAQRTVWAMELLDHYCVDVAGLQEFQRSQARSLAAHDQDGTWGMWHPAGDTENAIVWRRATFDLAAATSVTVPYFDGHPRRMPLIRLRDRTSGQEAWFLNVHNPADTARFHHQARHRAEAVRREVAAVTRAASTGLPVFVTGDANDHAEFFCPFTNHGLTTAAAGGANTAGCRPPPSSRARIDWILGTRGVRFTGYTVDDGPLVDRTSDHPFTVTQAQVD